MALFLVVAVLFSSFCAPMVCECVVEHRFCLVLVEVCCFFFFHRFFSIIFLFCAISSDDGSYGRPWRV